jgi:hypothetical protein
VLLQVTNKTANGYANLSESFVYYCAGAIQDVQPAKQIVEDMVNTAIQVLRQSNALIVPASRL